MAKVYGPILTGVGLLKDGKLTKTAKDKYIEEVVALLLSGNANGQGGSPSTKIFNSLFPLPPIPGPTIFNITTLTTEPVFWFETDPIAAIIASQLVDPSKCPMWHAIFPDLLYEKTAIAMDANGTTPLFPIFDVGLDLDVDLPIPFTLPDLAAQLKITPPDLAIKLADLGIKLSLPSIPLPPIPPPIPFPSFDVALPPLVLPDLLLGLIKLPFDLLLKFTVPPDIKLVLDLPNLPKLVLGLAFDIVINLLIDLGILLVVPKIFVASILIYIKDVVAMVCTDIVGMLVGAGTIAKSVATLTGLI